MKQERIQELIAKFNSNNLSESEQREVESLIESGEVDFSAFDQLAQFGERIAKIEFPSPSRDLDDRFYQMLAIEKRSKLQSRWEAFFSWPQLAPRLAFASVALIAGIAIGYLIQPSDESGAQTTALVKEVSDLREMVMLSLLEKESATERLRAVSLTQEMNTVSTEVTEALIKTLNQDENVNVRLAALEALKPYIHDSKVREDLIRSIARQNSPLVQVALAEFMAAIQERSSVKELEKIIQSRRTPAEIKDKIKQSIKVLS
jgi:hypothetical protein